MATMDPSMLSQMPAQELPPQIPPKPSRVAADRILTKYKRQQAKYNDLQEDQTTLKEELKKAEAKAAKLQAECDLILDQLLAGSIVMPQAALSGSSSRSSQPIQPSTSYAAGQMSRSSSQPLPVASASVKRYREDTEAQDAHGMQEAKRFKVGDLLN